MEDKEWMKSYIKLKKFLNEKGYPQSDSKDEVEKSLAEFVRCQREDYQNNSIPKYREKLLNDIHFCWSYNKVKNDNSIETWQNFQTSYAKEMLKQNGSRIKKNGEYQRNKLLEWEQQQKKQENKGGLEDDREYELAKIGFYFDDSSRPLTQRRSVWFKNYNYLIELLKKVDGSYEEVKTLKEFKSISKWFMMQIEEEKNGALEDYRRILLENISFPFENLFSDNV